MIPASVQAIQAGFEPYCSRWSRPLSLSLRRIRPVPTRKTPLQLPPRPHLQGTVGIQEDMEPQRNKQVKTCYSACIPAGLTKDMESTCLLMMQVPYHMSADPGLMHRDPPPSDQPLVHSGRLANPLHTVAEGGTRLSTVVLLPVSRFTLTGNCLEGALMPSSDCSGRPSQNSM